jgi:hypothetical protein
VGAGRRVDDFSQAIRAATERALEDDYALGIGPPTAGSFHGVDLRRLAAVELGFGVRGRRAGSIQLADMAFQP